MKHTTAWLPAIAFVLVAPPVFAQNWSFDARDIGLSGVSGIGTIASDMVAERGDYTSIVIPLGLLQIPSRNVFDAGSPEFDPVLAAEYASSPVHFTVGRKSSNTAQTQFVSDLRNENLSRNLSTYKGFVPANDLLAEGLASPRFGHTFWLTPENNGRRQGLYVGGGPYLSMRSDGAIDPALTSVLESGVNAPNALLKIGNTDLAQGALDVTVGYRGRYALPEGMGSGAPENGLFFALNYDYLRGFGYIDEDMTVRLATDASGQLTNGSSILINHRRSTKGNGLAIDLGIEAVVDRWEVGFGADGMANRINWKDVQQVAYSTQTLFTGDGDFVEGPTVTIPDARVELPVDYRGHVRYYADRWSTELGIGHGFGGTSFHGGLERSIGEFQVRGGVRHTFDKWNPSAGIGFNLNPRLGFDLAVFGTNTNIELERHMAIAASIRINHGVGVQRPEPATAAP